jgi:hypothetical protein
MVMDGHAVERAGGAIVLDAEETIFQPMSLGILRIDGCIDVTVFRI